MPCQDWLGIYFNHISVVNTNAKRLDVSHVFRIALKIVAGIHQDLIEDLVEARYKVDLRIIIVACCSGKNWQGWVFLTKIWKNENHRTRSANKCIIIDHTIRKSFKMNDFWKKKRNIPKTQATICFQGNRFFLNNLLLGVIPNPQPDWFCQSKTPKIAIGM